MNKRTVPELAEFLAEATGLPDSSLRSLSRRLREAGLLSQHGHGRGAAAATAEDAATLLLVAATEFPPLHAALVGQALWACKPDLEPEDDEVALERQRVAEPFLIDGDPWGMHIPGIETKITLRIFRLPVASCVIDGNVVEPGRGWRITEGEEVFEIQPPDNNTAAVELLTGGYYWRAHTKQVT